jgi:hypothetical protein
MSSEQTVFERWWPATQSLDLIAGDMEAVAGAVAELFKEVADYSGDAITTEWCSFPDVDAAFRSVPYFDNVGSRMLLLPTRSRWVVVWTNSFLCGGYDHFLWRITLAAGLTTIHWSAHDTTTTFQPGAMFHLRRMDGAGLVERRVQAARTDRRWDFFELGEPLPEEDVDGYRAPRKRDRMNERRLMELLARLGARPWDEAWYALPGQRVFRLERPTPPAAQRRDAGDVITGAHGSAGALDE